ncbi:MAG: type II toxin-antitoxin system RelE/ParE family toxin [Bdellovibrionales bacterium]
MIKSFADKRTAAIFAGYSLKRMQSDVVNRAHKKLLAIDAATAPSELREPPGNWLEALSGNRGGYWSIRVNDQWRICFRFVQGNAFDVELVDYH